ncbi:MAG: phosphate acyltransferase PlsX [Gammaproteobacteria bacterium]|nr:phosphate acyltransferase PlsX [Gammaproteobacteria bacterium]MCY4227080.1 phosphate acyltransferase PlsX [Gammaproteobacteria bacterium]MCY4312110.1 phosphate acyltransferase PlsX [Gammaproteobacteria bacterium]
MITIAIDAMGGDHGLEVTIPASVNVVDSHLQVKLILVGREAQIRERLDQHRCANRDRISVQSASEIVAMDDPPAFSIRKKKDSSMRVAVNLVKDGIADACVSAGNTGALMGTAKFVLGTIRGIDRPAICGILPRISGSAYVLDLGANVDVSPEILFQFGIMGSQLIESYEGRSSPTVGLLNIGVEEGKGDEAIKAAAELFKNSSLNYVGYVEADHIFMGDTDLIVCDGVLGNVALKASEGVAQFIMSVIKQEFTSSAFNKLSALVSRPTLNAVKSRLDHRRYNGATLMGLNAVVVKSHGGTDTVGFGCAIEYAVKSAGSGLVERISQRIAARMETETIRESVSAAQADRESPGVTSCSTQE